MTSSMLQNPHCYQKELGPGLTRSLEFWISGYPQVLGSQDHQSTECIIIAFMFVYLL